MRGQVWSVDLVIGVIIFLSGIGIFFFFTHNQADQNQSQLMIESQYVADILAGENDQFVGIVNRGVIDEDLLNQFLQKDYANLRATLGTKSDFCMVLVKPDGEFILLNNGSDNTVGFGNANLTINLSNAGYGVYSCGEAFA